MSDLSGVYTVCGAEDAELCHPVDRADFQTLDRLLNGTSRKDEWRPIQMEIIREDEGKTLSRSDSPWLGSHALIFRLDAALAMGQVLSANGELLPLTCSDADLVVFNPTRVLDALDEAASTVTRFKNGRLMRISSHVFHADVVAGIDAFKISSLMAGPTFVSGQFVERWESQGLAGLEFTRVWSASE